MERSGQQADVGWTFVADRLVPALRFKRGSLRIVAASRALCDALGHSPDALLSMTVSDLLEPQDLTTFEASLDDPGAGFEQTVWHLRCQSGTTWSATMRCDSIRQDGVDTVVAVFQNAEKMVEAQRARDKIETRLREQTANLRVAQDLIGIGVWKMDLETGQLVWNENVHAIYGVGPDAFAGDVDAYVRLVHPDDREEMTGRLAQFQSSGAPEFSFRHRILRPDGTSIHVRGAAKVEDVGDGLWLTGVVQDVTTEQKSLAELEEAMRMQRMAGRMAHLGCWRVDLDPLRIIWNAEMARIFDVPVGTSPSLDEAIDFYVPEHRARIRTHFEVCADTGTPFDDLLRIRTAKGRLLWVRAIGEAVRDRSGRIVAVEGAFQDISELVAVRDESAALARRLHQTLESISDAFILLDKDWRFAFLNSQAEDLLQRKRKELLGKFVWDEFPDAVGSTFQTEYQRAVLERQAVEFQEYFPPLQAWFEVNAYPTPEGLAVYFRDITQQRKRDDLLRLLEAAVSRQNDLLIITEAEPIDGPDGPKIVFVNDAFVNRTGYSREEVIGKSPRILQGPRTQKNELARIRAALEKWSPVRSELINYTKSGEEFWLELDIVPLADSKGWFTHWVAIERDITERKQAEQALLANEERFRLVAKATGNAVWDWDIARGRQWWSEGLHEIFGHRPDPDETVPTLWRAQVHPDDVARVTAAFKRLETGEDDAFFQRYRFRRADGNWATVEDRAFVVRNSEGQAMRILGSMTDISERIHLEDRLRQAQKLEAVGQLTGGVAHDFNNLLTVILGNSETLAEQLDGQKQLRMLAEMVASAAERGAELTNRLLAFSRRQPLDPRVVDISSLVQGMENLLRRTLPEDIDIEIIRAGGLWKTEVDPVQLESALLNLAVNARDAMPRGGCLTIETANAALDDEYVANEQGLQAGQYVLIIVSDTGHGMTSDTLTRIFEPFFTTKDVGKGSGLGLSMVYGFVKQSGGHIRVYSEYGLGTSVKLYFPRAHVDDAAVVMNASGRSIPGGDELILVVEDDDLVRENLVAQLRALGYRVQDAPNGTAALEILKRTPEIDLLFTDVVMPGGLDGRALADAARMHRPDLPVLFTSGYTENAIVHNGRLDPGVELISKPYRRAQLAAKVRKVLDRRLT